jgi:hypothetical protein
METSLRERLIEGVKYADSLGNNTASFSLMVIDVGVVCLYSWKNAKGHTNRIAHLVSWEELERAKTNPLIIAVSSLTKKAAGLQ